MGSADGTRLKMLLTVVCAIFVYQQVLGPIQTLIVQQFSRRINGNLRSRVMRAALRPSGIAHLERADLLDKVRDAQGVGEGQFTPGGAVGALVSTLTLRLNVLAMGVIVAGFRWWLAFVLVGFGAVVRYRLVEDMLRTAQSGRGMTEGLRRADYLRELALTPDAAKETRVFGLGAWLLDRFKTQWLGSMELLWRERRERDSSPWSWSIPWGVITFGAVWIVGSAGISGELSLGRTMIMVQAVFQAGNIWISNDDVQLAYGATSVPAVRELEEALQEPELSLGGSDAAGLPHASISIEGVHFSYPGSEDPVLSGVDLQIPVGRSLAIVGVNGAGKTTLVKLLARLYDPTAGRIVIDGVDLQTLDASSWQRQLAAIFQDFTRFELSARDNVAFGGISRTWTDAELEGIAARVGAADMITALPKGWGTTLSRQFSDGADLSGGQWQRLALARAVCAVAAGAQLLILDEPTANLDVRAEAELFARFLEVTRGVTTILISHRFSTVRLADQICVLENGLVTEQGGHRELLAAGGEYARLFRLQAARFVESDGVEPSEDAPADA